MSKSLLNKYTVEEIKNIIQTSQTMSEVMRKLGYNEGNNGPRTSVKNFAIKNGFGDEIEKLKQRSKKFNKEFIHSLKIKNRTNESEMFCENSMATRAMVRKRVLADKLLEYKCAICGNPGEHNGLPLVLQLDHINGIANDHRLENLRWICPNCHSQTETFCSRNHEQRRAERKEIQNG